MTTFAEFIEKPSSKKAILAWIEPSYRLQGWTTVSTDKYSIAVEHFVVGVSRNGEAFTKVSNPTSNGEYSYNELTSTIVIYTTSSPETNYIRADFRMFYGSGNFILPYDLDGGTSVDYEGLINSTSSFGSEFDSNQLGVMLTGTGSISLINSHGEFDSIFEKYFWENKNIFIYSWSPDILASEAKLIFRGKIKNKRFSSQEVVFEALDFIADLENEISLGKFEAVDGDFPENIIGSYKRRVYGRVEGLRCLSLDQTLDGYSLSGTVSIINGTDILTGTSTSFLSELSPEDVVQIGEDSFKIQSVESDTSATLVNDVSEDYTLLTATVKPKIPYRMKNRSWHIAGHELKRFRAQIVSIEELNRFTIDTNEGIEPGDTLFINGESCTVRRITSEKLVLLTSLNSTPTIGDYFYKEAVQGVNWGTVDFLPIRDYDLNNSTEAMLEIEPLAEFNIAQEIKFTGTATFTGGSRLVTGTGTMFDIEFKPRDWIRTIDNSTYYEVLNVISATAMNVRTAFAASTTTIAGYRKNPTYLNDDSILTVSCLGKTKSGDKDGDFIKTTAEVIYDILEEQNLSSFINTSAFDLAKKRFPYLVSYKIPFDFSSQNPTRALDVVNAMTSTSMGALYFDNALEISYSAINAQKSSVTNISDHDIISFSVETKTEELARETIASYRHQDAGRYTQEEAVLNKSYVNDFVSYFMDTSRSKTFDAFLYNEEDVYQAVRRIALINETPSVDVKIETKLNLSGKNIGDVILVQFDRLQKRFASDGQRSKIGVITAIRKNGYSTSLTISDFGGLFTKVACFASPAALDYSTATDSERVLNGYFVGTNELSDTSKTYRINLFG